MKELTLYNYSKSNKKDRAMGIKRLMETGLFIVLSVFVLPILLTLAPMIQNRKLSNEQIKQAGLSDAKSAECYTVSMESNSFFQHSFTCCAGQLYYSYLVSGGKSSNTYKFDLKYKRNTEKNYVLWRKLTVDRLDHTYGLEQWNNNDSVTKYFIHIERTDENDDTIQFEFKWFA